MTHAQNLPVNRPADYVSPFIAYTEAIGRLVVAGVDVTWERVGMGGGQIVDKATGDVIGFCYRDGSSWKIKAEHVEDYIEYFRGEMANTTKGRKPFEHGEQLIKNSHRMSGLVPVAVESPVTFYRYLTAEDKAIYTGDKRDCIVLENGNQILCDSNLLDRA